MLRVPDVSLDDHRPVVHHFDEPSWRAWRPGFTTLQEHPSEIFASQSPLDQLYLATEGGGALGAQGAPRLRKPHMIPPSTRRKGFPWQTCFFILRLTTTTRGNRSSIPTRRAGNRAQLDT